MPENYQIPQLQFDDLQEKIVVDKALSPLEENTAIRVATNVKTTSVEDHIHRIPRGSVIHHSTDGITTVFDKNGIQLFSVDDAHAGLVTTPTGAMPATKVHELPSGSLLYPQGNTTFVVFNDEIILAEVNEIPMITTDITQSNVPQNSDTLERTEGMDASSISDSIPHKFLIERVRLDYYLYDRDSPINTSSVQWTVPKAPKIVRPSQIQYIEFVRYADEISFDHTIPGSYLSFAPALEWNRYTNTWDIATWIQNYNISRDSYYSTGITVETGDLITGSINSSYDFSSTDYRKYIEYWSVEISNQLGQTSNLYLIGKNMVYIIDYSTFPLEYRLVASGDGSASSEENFVGDITFTNFKFTKQKDVPIDTRYFSVWGTYVNSAFKGKPGFMDMKIENNWPNSFVLRTQAEPVQEYTYSLTCVEDYDDPNIGRLDGVIDECNNVKTRLNATPGWSMKFYNKDADVTPNDFGISDTYHPSLVDSTFHYHSGHGVDKLHTLGILGTIIMLKDYTDLKGFFHQGGIFADQVTHKWGGKNKWVMIQSCNILAEKKWGDALTTSHGILGYASSTNENSDFPNIFFDYALNEKESMVDAYRDATEDAFNDINIKGAVFVKTIDQYENEQFPGAGYSASDGDPNAKPIYREWTCVKKVSE